MGVVTMMAHRCVVNYILILAVLRDTLNLFIAGNTYSVLFGLGSEISTDSMRGSSEIRNIVSRLLSYKHHFIV